MNAKETVKQIPISRLIPFPIHPFYVRDDELMMKLMESIRQVGILNPVIVRPAEDECYELISGHRRK